MRGTFDQKQELALVHGERILVLHDHRPGRDELLAVAAEQTDHYPDQQGAESEEGCAGREQERQ